MSCHFEPVQLGSIELFCRAAELGSFTSAAQALGLTPTMVGCTSNIAGKRWARSKRQNAPSLKRLAALCFVVTGVPASTGAAAFRAGLPLTTR